MCQPSRWSTPASRTVTVTSCRTITRTRSRRTAIAGSSQVSRARSDCQPPTLLSTSPWELAILARIKSRSRAFSSVDSAQRTSRTGTVPNRMTSGRGAGASRQAVAPAPILLPGGDSVWAPTLCDSKEDAVAPAGLRQFVGGGPACIADIPCRRASRASGLSPRLSSPRPVFPPLAVEEPAELHLGIRLAPGAGEQMGEVLSRGQKTGRPRDRQPVRRLRRVELPARREEDAPVVLRLRELRGLIRRAEPLAARGFHRPK